MVKISLELRNMLSMLIHTFKGLDTFQYDFKSILPTYQIIAHACTHTHARTHARTHTHTRTHARTHTHTHTHTHVYTTCKLLTHGQTTTRISKHDLYNVVHFLKAEIFKPEQSNLATCTPC